MGKMMKQVQKMQQDMAKLQEDLKDRLVEASVGGGVVRVVVNGQQEVREIHIDKSAVDPDDVEMLEDMVLAAVNEAMRKSQELGAAEMAKITGGMNIPGMPGGLF